MLRLLNLQEMESDAGYSIQILSRDTLEYAQGSSKLTIQHMPGYDTYKNRSIAIISNRELSHWGNSWTPFTDDEKRQIIEYLTEGLNFLGVDVIFED